MIVRIRATVEHTHALCCLSRSHPIRGMFSRVRKEKVLGQAKVVNNQSFRLMTVGEFRDLDGCAVPLPHKCAN